MAYVKTWSTKEEVLKDLAKASGRRIRNIDDLDSGYLVIGDVPPHVIPENEDATELEIRFGGAVSGKEIHTKEDATPDLAGIQHMLRMVNEKKDEQQAYNPADSSDLDPHNPEYVTQNIQKKNKRNVAFESIMAAKNAELSDIRPMSKDVIPFMFKKKSLNHSPQHNVEETSKNAPPSQTSSHLVKQYTPSTHASEYYMKYVQKSELREEFEEDIWARAERQMKEVEVREKRKAEIVSPKESGNESPPGVACASFDVNLPKHRHLMPGDCIVCIVAAKHGYYF